MGRRGKSAAAYSVITQPNLLRSIATLVCLAHVALRARWQKGKAAPQASLQTPPLPLDHSSFHCFIHGRES